MRKSWVNRQYRRLYQYICKGCGKYRLTVDFDRHQRGLCTQCEEKIPDPNQPSFKMEYKKFDEAVNKSFGTFDEAK